MEYTPYLNIPRTDVQVLGTARNDGYQGFSLLPITIYNDLLTASSVGVQG